MKLLSDRKNNGLIMIIVMLVSLIPISLFALDIDLLSPVDSIKGQFFTLLTNSAGSKGFLFTLALFGALFLSLKLPRAVIISRGAQLAILLIIGFASKTGLKHLTESPRPYTELLTQELLIPQPEHFYNLDAAQKALVIDHVASKVSDWRTIHWQGEKDYSFPSGHTIFAAICVAFFAGIFLDHKRYGLVGFVLLWSLGVAYSRLWLGMHRPVDLFGSVLFIGTVYAALPDFHTITEKLLLKLPVRWRSS